MNINGRSRNARLNQAAKHAHNLINSILELQGYEMNAYIGNKEDAWQDGRNALEQLVQCFHEANAYNNAMVHKDESK